MKLLDFSQQIPVEENYDVLVIGGGMAGVTAALTAAGNGLKTALVEYFGDPGGIPVNGALSAISGLLCGDECTVGGFALKLLDELIAKGYATTSNNEQFICDPVMLSGILNEKLLASGVELRYFTQLIGAKKNNNKATHAIVASKSGIEALGAKLFIDASGDGDMACFLGCPFKVGRSQDGKVQSSTLVFTISGFAENLGEEELLTIRKIWKSKPRSIPINHTPLQFILREGRKTELVVNMVHITDCNPLDVKELTRIKTAGFTQAQYILDFMKTETPWFKYAWINRVGVQPGIRETRRFTGDYILNSNDLRAGRDFPDAIARCGWGIDIHNPDGVHTGIGEYLKKTYSIPYRCITPQGIDNLYIAGRPISATHTAFSSVRINSTCIALGETAGMAAKMAIKSGSTRKINIKELQQNLIKTGAILDREQWH